MRCIHDGIVMMNKNSIQTHFKVENEKLFMDFFLTEERSLSAHSYCKRM